MLPDYHLKITDDYNFFISNVKKIIRDFFGKEKYVFYY